MFTSAELAYMREVQTAHMMDTCVIYRVTERVRNSRGEYTKTFANGVESICGLQLDPVTLSPGDAYQVAEVDAILRLPVCVTVEPGDEIEITKRFGEAIDVQRYEVERFVNRGPSGGRAYLKYKAVA